MKLGFVEFCHSYLVDLDNPEMVQHAKDALYQDIETCAQDGAEFDAQAKVRELRFGEEHWSEGDIPDFLTEDDEEDD